ncbi:MAG: hypothetical protein LBK53_05115 [Heliobacteriaceae bacterium]|jgi:hypothetical protein|nr:hypothetical protein [Heliobacteriaceae bacterium]
MDEKRKLTVIEKTDEKIGETPKKTARQTNPIAKKLLRFHHNEIAKFSVKDLFKS